MTRFRAQCPWHGGVTPMLLMCAAVARGGVVDVSDALEYVATPPALGSCYNSTTRYNIIQDLHYWNGKVYAGFGDYSANKGPIPIVAIDPATKETTAELSLGTEEIARFVTDSQGRLWVLCIDQQGSQTYARRPVGGDWEVSTKPSIWYETSKGWNTSGDGNVAMNTHIWDMAQFGDNFFLCGYGFAGSSDDGATWTLASNGLESDDEYAYTAQWYKENGEKYQSMRERVYGFINTGDALYCAPYNHFSFNPVFYPQYFAKQQAKPRIWKYDETSGRFKVSETTWDAFAPGMDLSSLSNITTQTSGGATLSVRHSVTFNSHAVYSLVCNYASDTTPLDYVPICAYTATSGSSLSPAKIEFGERTFPFDVVVSAGRIYFLVARISASGTVSNEVWASDDGASFELFATFTKDNQVATALEVVDGVFYFGFGPQALLKYGAWTIGSASGSSLSGQVWRVGGDSSDSSDDGDEGDNATHKTGWERYAYRTSRYVQDGLVVHLDGLCRGAANTPSSGGETAWTNLVDSAMFAEFVHRADDGSAWSEDGYLFGGSSYAILSGATAATTNLTIELYGDFPAASNTRSYPNYVSANNSSDFGIWTQNGGTTLNWKSDAYGGQSYDAGRTKIADWGGVNFTAVLGEDTVRLYENGVLKSSLVRTKAEVPAVKWVVANSGASASYLTGSDYSRQAAGTLKSLRVYNRELTDDEIAHNAAIDRIRFANAAIPSDGFTISIR